MPERLRIEGTVLIERFEKAPLDFLVEDFRGERTPTWPGDRAEVMSWLGAVSLGSSPIETFLLLDRLNHAVRDRFRYARNDR